jgi:hypothetical protein
MDTDNTNTRQYLPPEIHALGDRLYNRGTSKLFTGSPELQLDLCVAAALLWALASMSPPSGLRVNVWKEGR